MTYEATREFLGIGPDDNIVAAIDAYEWVTDHPDEAPFVLSAALYEKHNHVLRDNAEVISKMCDDFIDARLSSLKPLVIKSVIAKSKNGEEAEELGVMHKALELISKARRKTSNRQFDSHMSALDPTYSANRGAFSEQQHRRNALGQFGNMNHTPVAAGVGYDVMSAMTNNPNMQIAAGISANNIGTHNAFTDYWELHDRAEETGSNAHLYNQLASGASLAQSIGGPFLGPTGQAALAAAQFAGTHAVEAEKVVGPAARKANYRYRGVEKTPDPKLQKAVDDYRAHYRNKAIAAGRTPADGDTDAREALIYGVTKTTEIMPSNPGQRIRSVTTTQESPVVQHLMDTLPSQELYTLSRKSGTIPPSQGIIIDRHGKIATEAVGYGDDWDLPFNPKSLSKLNGGEYIRTRGYGGLTSEDVRAGLISGARAITVVSHSGVYTLEFDDDFRGARRYSDKSKRMVDRYEYLLDSLSSGQVSIGTISPARKKELAIDASAFADRQSQPREWNAARIKLEQDEVHNPKLAAVEIDAIRREAADKAVENLGYANSSTYAHDQIIKTNEAYKAKMARAADPVDAEIIEMDKIQALQKYQWPELVNTLGATDMANNDIIKAQENLERSMHPLGLDAMGYQKAQEALVEQFPYYFKRDPEYREPADRNHTKDPGYIKPRYNRPVGAYAGYWNKSITGSSKVTADQAAFQNMKHRSEERANYNLQQALGRDGVTDSAPTGSTGNTGVQPPVNTRAPNFAARANVPAYRAAALSVASNISSPTAVFRSNTAARNFSPVAGGPVAPIAGRTVASTLASIVARDPTGGTLAPIVRIQDMRLTAQDIESVYAENGQRAQDLNDLLEAAIRLDVLDIPQQEQRDFLDLRSGGSITGIPAMIAGSNVPTGDQITSYLGSGQNRTWNFGRFNVASQDIQDSLSNAGLSGASDSAQINRKLTALGQDWSRGLDYMTDVVNPNSLTVFQPNAPANAASSLSSDPAGAIHMFTDSTGTANPRFALMVHNLMRAKQAAQETEVASARNAAAQAAAAANPMHQFAQIVANMNQPTP